MSQPPESRLRAVFTRRQALAAGLTRHHIEWAIASGRWLTLRRGAYSRRDVYDACAPVERHLLHSEAALLTHDDRHVLSHLSAALSYGLPAPLRDLGRPSLTIGGAPASTDRQDDLVVQVAGLRERDVIGWRGQRRTSTARTVVDCLRHLPALESVPIADEALRRGLASAASLEDVLRWQGGWPMFGRAVQAVPLIDPRRESWLESYSFVALHGQGIGLPVPQVEVFDAGGRFVGRVDGLWADQGTVAEADGRTKYALADWPDLSAAAAQDLVEARYDAAVRALVREKRREDALRDLGLEVVRWGTADVVHGVVALAARVREAWRRGDPARFSGTTRCPAIAHALAVESG